MSSISSATNQKLKKKKTGWERLKQQELAAWQPIFSPRGISPLFLVFGVLLIPLGVLIFTMSKNIQELKFDYTDCLNSNGDKCSDIVQKMTGESCSCIINFQLEEPMKGKIRLYYALSNFYQNHREYVASRDDDQLLGKIGTSTPISPSSDCDPFGIAPNGKIYFPCGAIANSMFNDTYTMFRHLNDGSKTEVRMIRTGIAWESDKKHKFKNPDLFLDINNTKFWDKFVQPRDWGKSLWDLDKVDANNNGLQNEDLIVWMRVSALPNFRKLHRFIDMASLGSNGEMPKGSYSFEIQYNYEVASFEGTKTLILTEQAFFGGRNVILGIILMSVGSFVLLLGLILLLLSFKRRTTWSRGSKISRDYGTQGTTTVRRSKIA
ncbi:cell cycle control protein 50A [Folsomia candida]|uniref:Cell cycle control protein 50A n=1 Tax=Folsomia candida TaxID=158441 RepID=A0A226EK85_FOLCA|nr:cell cycle control protein 50A [Folsomia candida]OXA58115.1 Cell cycle control protein 50A [Folsomia candida]